MKRQTQFQSENLLMSVLGHLVLVAIMVLSFSLVVERAKLVTPNRIQIVEIDLKNVKISGDETKLYNTNPPKVDETAKIDKKETVKPVKPIEEKVEIKQPTLIENEEKKPVKENTKKDKEVVWNVIQEFGLEDKALTLSKNLSGGEQQLVAIARSMAQEPKVLVFDEPTSNLDVANEMLLENRIQSIAKERGITVLISMHDLSTAYDLGDKFVFIKDGEVLAQGTKEIFTEENVYKTLDRKCKIQTLDGTTFIKFEKETS